MHFPRVLMQQDLSRACSRGADCASRTGTFVLMPDLGMPIDAGDMLRIGGTDIAIAAQPADESGASQYDAEGCAPAPELAPARRVGRVVTFATSQPRKYSN